ncbi:hypothetical protein HK096_006822 [Nowakowskiella sp. JEL0078]|nr:hypothetical protein HK096_006822 [Nowakowskiella sp. JEL0078]
MQGIDMLVLPIERLILNNRETRNSTVDPLILQQQLQFLNARNILGSVDMNEYARRFNQRSSAIISGSFAKYCSKHLDRLFATATPNLEGLFFNNLEPAVTFLGKKEIVKAIQLISQEWPKLIVILDDGLFLLEDVRDYINGVTVRNYFLTEQASIRARYGSDKAWIDQQIKRLNFEISIRNDFLVIDVEIINTQISPALTRHFIKCLQSSKFVGWTTTSENFANLGDVRPMEYTEVSDDSIFEMCAHPALVNARVMIEQVYRILCTLDVEIDSRVWDAALAECKFTPRIQKYMGNLSKVRKSELRTVMCVKRLTPQPPQMSGVEDLVNKFLLNDGSLVDKFDSPEVDTGDLHEFEPIGGCLTAFGLQFGGEARKLEIEDHILAVLKKMREKKLLASLRFANGHTSGDLETPVSEGFKQYLKTINDIYYSPSACTKQILEIMGYEVTTAFLDLHNRIKQDYIRLWSAGKGSFLVKNETIPYSTVWGLVGNDDGKLDFYISDNHPNYLEVIVHLYFKIVMRYPNNLCILVESLIAAQEIQSTQPKLAIPSRFEWQIINSSVSERLTFTKNTQLVIQTISKTSYLTTSQKRYLQALALHIHRICDYHLIELPAYKSAMLEFAKVGYIPINQFEKDISALVGWATLDPQGMTTVLEFARHVHAAVTHHTRTADQPTELVALCYIFMCFWKACRHAGWGELEVALLGRNALFLPEADQSAVSLEMSTTQSNMNNLFDLTSLELSIPMQQRMRTWARSFAPASDEFKIEAVVETQKGESPHLIVNAFIFVYPILLDLILINFLGSGLFCSGKMNESTQDAFALMFLVMFPVLGGIMNSIGRSCTYFFFQKSFPLMLATFVRRLGASVLITVFVAMLLGIVTFLRHGWLDAVVCVLYAFVFMLFMVFLTISVTFRDIDDYFFNSKGPRAVFQSLLIPIAMSLLARFVIPNGTVLYNMIISGGYILSLLLAAGWMCIAFSGLSKTYLTWPEGISVTPKKEILEMFQLEIQKPKIAPEESQICYERRIRLWERAAREYFMEKLEIAVKHLFKRNVEKVIQKRVQQFRRERLLMAWYSERTSLPLPARFSAEWDSMLTQAVGELKKKYHSEKNNRGDLLFDLEIPAIIFGFLYFMIIFLDKWSVLIISGRATFFLSAFLGDSYIAGTIWATVFMLLASGFLEISLGHIFSYNNNLPPPRLAESGSHAMLEESRKSESVVYKRELLFFLRSILLVWILIGGVVAILYYQQWKVYILFGIASGGYIGLLCGLFHKIFLKGSELYMNIALGSIIVFSVIISAILIKFTGFIECALAANVLSGILFGIVTVAFHRNEDRDSLHYRVILSPSITSSGQSHVGSPGKPVLLTTTTEAREILVERLYRDSDLPLHPDSPLGQEVCEILDQASKRIESLPVGHVLRTALPDASRDLMDLRDRFTASRTVVHIMPEKYFVVTLMKALPGLAGLRTSKQSVDVIHRFTALGKLDPKEIQDQKIYIAAPNKNLVDVASYICEAMIHEYLELGGLSHATACVSEFLMTPMKLGIPSVPHRVRHQLKTADRKELQRLLCSTGENLISHVCLGIDVDRCWGNLSKASRLFLLFLAEHWDQLQEACLQGQDVTEVYKAILKDIPPELETLLRLNAGIYGNSIQIIEIFAIKILGSLFTLLIADMCSELMLNSDQGLATRPFDMDSTKHTGPRNQYFNKFRTQVEHLSLTNFLALTADPRMGREIDANNYNILLRSYFYITHAMTHTIIQSLQEQFIYKKRPEIRSLLQRVRKGLFREHHVTGSSQITRVDSFMSAIETVVSVRELNKDESTFTSYARYVGSKAFVWKPEEKDKMTSRAFFGNDSTRLMHEYHYDGAGKVVTTCAFEYQAVGKEDRFPIRQFVLAGETPLDTITTAINPSIQFRILETNTSLKEIHNYKSSVPGFVSSSLLFRQNPSNKSENNIIVALYTYNPASSLDNPIFDTITYLCDPEPAKGNIESVSDPSYISTQDVRFIPKWKIVLQLAQGVVNDGSKMKFRSAQFYPGTDENAPHYHTEFDYSHPQHTEMKTHIVYKDKGGFTIPTQTPPEIQDDSWGLLKLSPPRSFYVVNELLTFGLHKDLSLSWMLSSFKRSRIIQYNTIAYSTIRARQELWTIWRTGKLPGCFARDLDEQFLRKNVTLKQYWKLRDLGFKGQACNELTMNKETLDVVLIVADRPTTRSHLHIRFSDLFMLACGGDAPEISSVLIKKQAMVAPDQDETELLQVMNLDSGTWPTGGGGVGSCRRDLIDHLSRVRWTAIAEIGGAEMVQKDYQIERNVTSIVYLPLWDVDFGSPSENVYRTETFKTLRWKAVNTTNQVVNLTFVPLLKKIILGCMSTDLPQDSLEEYVRIFVDLYEYFQNYDWVTTWNHTATQDAWVTTWMEETARNHSNGNSLVLETPTLQEIDMLFSLLTRLLLVVTVKMPDIPVVHVSHHGVQAILGVISKHIHGSSLVIWDHGILWRERLFGLCEQDGMPRFVQIGFIGLTRLVARIAYAWADHINPCTSIQNVAWEQWLSGGKYLNNKEMVTASRKISPVLNGMDVTKFTVKSNLESEDPTAIMLSHVSPVKDVRNAILGASYIVNECKFTKYRLHIYGSPEKDPAYTNECVNLITSLNLSENVILKGLGNPTNVLPTGWIFVNSSITEGLPLALGEAGLCGLPVVCTDVGGSREVISNLKESVCYGMIVPPQKPRQLGLAQLKVLAMTDGLEQLIEPNSPLLKLEDMLAAGDIDSLYMRITSDDIKGKRRKLGLLLRARTVEVFNISRYWREHEQVLWWGVINDQVTIEKTI